MIDNISFFVSNIINQRITHEHVLLLLLLLSIDELEGDELADADSQPAYLKPSSLPVQPNNLPVTESNIPLVPAAGLNNNANKVDEYGLPLNA